MHLLILVLVIIILFKLDDLTAPVVAAAPPAPVDPVVAEISMYAFGVVIVLAIVLAPFFWRWFNRWSR